MYSQRLTPESISGKELDTYLAMGWYRMGQSIFTTQFLHVNERLYPAVWIRRSLEEFKFSKSQRKLINKNGKIFRIEYADAYITREKEALYSVYRQNFHGYISPTLSKSLEDNMDSNIYDTIEVCVYDGDRLVACSFFDLGLEAITSILGFYDPEYADYSLGYYTMLLEMQYGVDYKYKFYYPGYIVPGYAKFDYKLRIRAVEYWDLVAKKWLSYEEFDADEVHLEVIKRKLEEAQDYLLEQDISTIKIFYPLFEVNFFGYQYSDFLNHPLFLLHMYQNKLIEEEYSYRIITYDIFKKEFLLYECLESTEMMFFFNDLENAQKEQQKSYEILKAFLIKDKLLAQSPSLGDIVQILATIPS